MRVILHIGTEKTGTSSIQNYLYKNRRQLGGAGYHVLQSGGKYNSRALPAACITNKPDDYLRAIGVNTVEERQAHRESVIEGIARELSELPAGIHTVLISSEHFHSRIRSEEELGNVRGLLSRFFDQFKIICYLREQVSTCASWYSTSLKNRGTQSLCEFMERCTPRNLYFNYHEMLAGWERSFGLEALDVGLFSRDHLLNGDLLDDFTQRVDPGLVGSLKKQVKVENESLTPMGQGLARAINLTFPDDTSNPEVARTRDKFKEFIIAEFNGAGQFPPPEACRKLYESFVEGNEKVRQKFFPEVATLFQHPAEITRPSEGLEDSFVVSSLYLVLDKLKKELGGAIRAHDILCFCGVAAASISDLYNYWEEPSSKALGGIILNDAVARMLRDSAIKLEQVDVAKAASLMELAGKVNPSLPQVEERLEKYQELLQQKVRQRFMIVLSYGHSPKEPEELNALARKMSDWQKKLSIPPQTPMPVKSRTLLVGPDGAVSEEGDNPVVLYRVIEADSTEEAVEIAKKCPLLEVGGSVRVSRLAQPNKK